MPLPQYQPKRVPGIVITIPPSTQTRSLPASFPCILTYPALLSSPSLSLSHEIEFPMATTATLRDFGNTSIIGLQWGDEGKGKIVDLLTEHFDYAIRWNGGSHAGHSVKVADKKYALHLIPSGILRPDCTSVIANGVVVDPLKLLEEIDGLITQGIKVEENLKISTN